MSRRRPRHDGPSAGRSRPLRRVHHNPDRRRQRQPVAASQGTLRERILKLLRDPRYQPLDKVELTRQARALQR